MIKFTLRGVFYYNGTLIAASLDDLTVRIFEQVDGNFVQVQQTPVIDAGSLDQWGIKLFFLNKDEFYFGNGNIGSGVSMYIHRFVRLDNGTWADAQIIESQYLFDSTVAVSSDLIVSTG